MSIVYFIHAQPLNLETGQRVSVRIAGGGVAQSFRLNGENFKAGLVSAPRFSVAIEFGENGWTGGSTPNATPVIWQPSAVGDLAAVAPYYWPKAPITIDAGPDGGPFVRVFNGTVGDAKISGGALQLAVADFSVALDKPVVKDTFAGTGNLEGDDIAKGRTKRRCFGVCRNVEGRLLLAAWSIYEFADPSRPLHAFTAVKDMGRDGPVTVLAWQGTADATLEALKVAIPPAGGAVAAPSIACVRWWTEPAGPLTADVEGELTAGAFVATPLGVAGSVLSAVTGPIIANAGPLVGATGAVGLYLDRANESAAAILDRLFARLGCFWTVRPSGGIELFQWSITAPVEALQCQFISRNTTIEPAKELVITYQINNRVHSDGEISSAVRTDDGSTLEEVLALARARGKLTIGGPLPSVLASNIGDTHVDDGGVFYERAASGGIILGGKVVTLGGFRPALYWTPAIVQPLAATIATAGEAYGLANDAIDQLIGLADDGILSVNEKITKLIPEQSRLEAKWAVLSAQAATLTVSTVAAAAKRTAWLDMLAALSPAWNSINADSPVIRDTFNAARDEYDAALYELDQAIKGAVKALADAAATTAIWEGVTGAGRPEDGADVTANAVPYLEPSARTITVNADYLGVVDTGAFPINFPVRRYRGDVDVSSGSTWTIEGLSPSGAATVNVTSGNVSIIAVSQSCTFKVRAVRDGVSLDALISVSKVNAPVPNTGTASGGTTVSDTSFPNIGTSTAHTAISDLMTVKTGSSGQIALSAALEITPPSANPGGLAVMAFEWRWRPVGGSWTSLSEINSDPSPFVFYDSEVDFYEANSGALTSTQTITGLSASTNYEVQLFARRYTGVSRNHSISGNAVAAGS